ncbi:MAG: peptidyl-prolyl cis-trans isomerase [Acidobacteria bacterium]|nr:peptidyl-prolyl cis-trans isomerase [Acidobacteriota bacterium]
MSNNPRVMLRTTSGDIEIELFADKAPLTVENFLQYVDDGHFDGTIFHRVIDGFMIQGGGFDRNMVQRKTRPPIRNEANNGLKNTKYTLAMARTSDVNSATAQFFINVADNAFLDYKDPSPRNYGYAVFGKVTAGTDVVDRLRKVKTGSRGPHQDVPQEPIVIESASRLP